MVQASHHPSLPPFQGREEFKRSHPLTWALTSQVSPVIIVVKMGQHNEVGLNPRKAGLLIASSFIIASTFLAPVSAQDIRSQRIAVLPFETQTISASGAVASEHFNTQLVNVARAAVVERAELSKILGEQYLQEHSGLVDPETASRLHQVLGVDGIVLGRVLAVEHDAAGGSGALMMTARLVDTSSGRILWADTVTATVRESLGRRFKRFVTGAAPESDALVTERLLQRAAAQLAREMGSSLQPAALPYSPPPTSREAECSVADARITAIAESVLPEEALYWAHRLLEENSAALEPGDAYNDRALRERLNTKVLFWLDEKNVPALSKRQLERLADAKEAMREIRSRCAAPRLAKAGPPSSLLLASGRMP